MKPLNEAQKNPEKFFVEYYESLGINVEYEKYNNGFGKVRLRLKEPLGDRIETTPILLLPGIANPYQMNHGEQSLVDNHFLFRTRMT